MLKNQNIICISSIDWGFVWQGHQEIMSTFAKHGNKVLFIENTGVRSPGLRDIPRLKNRIKNWFKGLKGIRKEAENIYVFSPLVLPFPYSRIARWINRRLMLSVIEKWMRAVNFGNPIVWTFLPTGLGLDLLNNIDAKLIIYYCIADFSELVKHPGKINKTERKVIQKADLVFAQGEALKKHCEKYNPNVEIFPFGVNIDVFNLSRDRSFSEEVNDAEEGVKKPVIGYIGGIHRHIDYELLKFIADRNPGWTLSLVGPIQTDISKVKNIPNINFEEMKQHGSLVNCINKFDVCLIPYALSKYTETVYPTKLNEYLAMGKAVVSTSLPEMVVFNKKYDNIIYIGSNKEEFENRIKDALVENNEYLRRRRIEVAVENSWENRIKEMNELIERRIAKKSFDIEANWKESFLYFYRMTRRRIMKFATICLLVYLVVFKTNFIWFVASPLKISEKPQRVDAIVVFGGGVGETGSPGKSTIERARYAAKLYKNGYADKIIFSSGYTYTYNDAGNMRLIALSVGVPNKDIILEEKADNNYENVIFSRDILKSHGWDSILIVSSPYNMRRIKLVFDKLGKDVKVIYAPVNNSQFYDRIEGVRLEQAKAIMHEYLGILFYWFRGYV